MQDIATEELENIIRDKNRCAVRLEIVVNDIFRISETVEVLREVEKEVKGAEFFVYCPNLFMQVKIDEPDPRQGSRAVAAGAVLHSMHLDTLPYSSVIVIAPKGARQRLEEILASGGAQCDVVESL